VGIKSQSGLGTKRSELEELSHWCLLKIIKMFPQGIAGSIVGLIVGLIGGGTIIVVSAGVIPLVV
jgi:hypothetical protein